MANQRAPVNDSAIRIQLSSTSNWTNLVIQNPDLINDFKIVDSWGEFTRYDISKDGIAIDQELLNAKSKMEIGVIVDYTLSGQQLPAEIKFILEKSDLNSAKILVSKIVDHEWQMINEFDHNRSELGVDLNPLYFSVFVRPQRSNLISVRTTTARTGTIFYNGQIITMDQGNPSAEAIAVKDGLIIAVGSNNYILRFASQGYEVIDLGNKTIMPAFIDTHTHVFNNAQQDYASSQDLILANGIGTIGAMSTTRKEIERLQEFDKAVGLKVRTNIYMTHITNCGNSLGDWYTEYPPSQDKSEMLRIAGVKVFADGGSCYAPARSFPPYGDLFFSQKEMDKIVGQINKYGYQAAVHALGDVAVKQVLFAIKAASNRNSTDMRNRIEHTALVSDSMLGMHDQSGAVAIIFGAFPTCYFNGQSSQFGGITTPKDYRHWEWRWMDLMQANPNTVFAWHSDYRIFDMNPFVNLYGFVVRRQVAQDGIICEPPDWAEVNRLSVEEALQVMTINGAYALFMEDVVGSLEPGKFADLIIISDNPFTIQEEYLKKIEILMTMVNGETVYCRDFDDYCRMEN